MKHRNNQGKFSKDLRLYRWFLLSSGIGLVFIATFIGINTMYHKAKEFVGTLAHIVVVENSRAEEPIESITLPPLTLMEKIGQAEVKYKLPTGLLKKIIQCESNFRPTVYGDHGVAYGLLQFHEGTFNLFKREAGKSQLNYRNSDDQIELGAWAFAHGKQDHWSCYSKIK